MGSRRSGSSPEVRATVAARRARAIELRLSGRTYRQIADDLGYKTPAAVHTDVTRALEANSKELAERADVLREIELERLDAMLREANAIMASRHPLIDRGAQVLVDGQPVWDDRPRLMAMEKILRIEESRRRLLGLDAPTQIGGEMTVRFVIEGIDPGRDLE